MAQQVVIAGALFNDVPSISVPDSNSVYHPFVDPSVTTAAASDVAQGKQFIAADGTLTQGTASGGGATLITKSITANGTYNASSDNADGYSSVTVNVSGGGGGLEYETGTWTPASDASSHVIQFTNTHTTPPAYYEIVDATGTYSSTTRSYYRICYVQWDRLFGSSAHVDDDNSGTIRYGRYDTLQRGTSATTMATQGGYINYPATETGDSTTNHPRHWATETGIRAAGYYSSYYWRTGRTYKWIAVWVPTS